MQVPFDILLQKSMLFLGTFPIGLSSFSYISIFVPCKAAIFFGILPEYRAKFFKLCFVALFIIAQFSQEASF